MQVTCSNHWFFTGHSGGHRNSRLRICLATKRICVQSFVKAGHTPAFASGASEIAWGLKIPQEEETHPGESRATRGDSLPLQGHSRHILSSGVFHWLFLLPGTRSAGICMTSSYTSITLFKCHLLSKACRKHPNFKLQSSPVHPISLPLLCSIAHKTTYSSIHPPTIYPMYHTYHSTRKSEMFSSFIHCCILRAQEHSNINEKFLNKMKESYRC